MPRSAKRLLPVALLLAGLVSAAQAKFLAPVEAPVQRLITNTQAYIKEHPNDASGYYTLGRIHYLAFFKNRDVVGSTDREAVAPGKLPNIAPDFLQGNGGRGAQPNPDAQPLTDEQLAEHVRQAVLNFDRAIALDRKNPLHLLGLASILDQAAPMADKIGPIPDRKPGKGAEIGVEDLFKNLRSHVSAEREAAADQVRKHLPDVDFMVYRQLAVEKDEQARILLGKLLTDAWRIAAMEAYALAFDLSAEKDLKIENQPIQGLRSLVSWEAGTRYAALAKEVPQAARADVAARMEKTVKQLDEKPMEPITPIAFSLEARASLPDLLAPQTTVGFNLDGTRRPQAWSWVNPSTAILCWDPSHSGQITSGWQLFGSVTFNMFWTDGYRPLDALDDNRDGQLSGPELAGLALWFDRNSNGRSDPGEVLPIEQTDIAGLRVHPSHTDPTGSPAASQGLILRHGRTLPTYDWLATPSQPRP